MTERKPSGEARDSLDDSDVAGPHGAAECIKWRTQREKFSDAR